MVSAFQAVTQQVRNQLDVVTFLEPVQRYAQDMTVLVFQLSLTISVVNVSFTMAR
jgi:hypothetical protein